MSCIRLLSTAALAAALVLSGSAQAHADEITISGCVATTPGPTRSGERLLLFWAGENVMLTGVRLSPDRAVGTTGLPGGHIFYWVDDAGDLARHIGNHVEITGELEEIDSGEVEIEQRDNLTHIEFKWNGEEVSAFVPGYALDDGDDVDFDVLVRRIDVESIHLVSSGSCR